MWIKGKKVIKTAAGRFITAAGRFAMAAGVVCMATGITANAEEIEVPEEIIAMSEEIGQEYNICPEFLQAVAFQESSFQATAVNGNCVGLMQVNPEWHQERMARLGVTNLYDAESNMRVAADYLAELFAEYGEAALVLDIYNGNSRAKQNDREGNLSSYADAVLERSAELERAHGK